MFCGLSGIRLTPFKRAHPVHLLLTAAAADLSLSFLSSQNACCLPVPAIVAVDVYTRRRERRSLARLASVVERFSAVLHSTLV